MGALVVVGVLFGGAWIRASDARFADTHEVELEFKLAALARDISAELDGDEDMVDVSLATKLYTNALNEVHASVRILPASRPYESLAEHRNLAIAHAPLLDSFGTPVRTVHVEAPKAPPLEYRLARLGLHVLVAGAVLGFLVWIANRMLRAHCDALEVLALGRGDVCDRWTSREVRTLAKAVERWNRVKQQPVEEQTEPEDLTPTAPAQEPKPDKVETVRFQSAFFPARLVHEVAGRFATRAKLRGVDLRLFNFDGVPQRLMGWPIGIVEALTALLENALEHTRGGTIQIRVAFPPTGGDELRFEVRDTGHGVPYHAQNALRLELEAARSLDPRQAREGLCRASSIAARMGGKLDFESQPRGGSRFWFTVSTAVAPAIAHAA